MRILFFINIYIKRYKMAINCKTFIEKSNTIIKDSNANTGLNPVLELNYGNMLTRILIYFNHEKIKKLIEDKTYPDINKLHHFLHMTNASSIQSRYINEACVDSQYNNYKERASSFDLIFFYIPYEWDSSRGFDYTYDLYNGNHRAVSTNGCTWYKYKNYFKWDNEGIYTTDQLFKELDFYNNKEGNKSEIIFDVKHFDYGNENLIIDITDTVNKFILGERENYGIGIAFAPNYENKKTDKSQYVGFFGPHTNSFYEPYVETIYCDNINDDRINFTLNKMNRLYFYTKINGNSVNLDELPKCTIEDKEYEVKQTTKGAYYVEIYGDINVFEADTMYYDLWSNIIYNGNKLDDIELNFTVNRPSNYYNFGLPNNNDNTDENIEIIPNLYGINYKERLKRGDIRKINVECKIPYTSKQLYNVNDIQYRLYTMSGNSEIDIINWSKVEKGYNEYYFLINTNDLLPSRYYIDIKISFNNEIKIHYKQSEFDIVNDVTEVYV